MNLERDYPLKEVAAAMGKSTRWVRDRIRLDGVEHIRYGREIRFTAEQVDKLRAAHTKQPAPVQAITSGKKRKAS